MRFVLALVSAAGLIAGTSAGGGAIQDPPAGQQQPQPPPQPPAQPAPPQTPDAPSVVDVGADIPTPAKTRDVTPIYPPEAQARGISGIVVVEIIVGVDGKVTDARVVRSVPELDAAALTAVRQWEFQPTLINGKPTAVRMAVTVRFSLGPDDRPSPGAAAPAGEKVDCVAMQRTPAARSRRAAAIRFVEAVNERQRSAMIEFQSPEFRSWDELTRRPVPPDDFEVQVIARGKTYSVSLISTNDVCRFGVFSDQRGIVYVGTPVE